MEYHVHIWQVSLHPSCVDTGQTGKCFIELNRHSWKIKKHSLTEKLTHGFLYAQPLNKNDGWYFHMYFLERNICIFVPHWRLFLMVQSATSIQVMAWPNFDEYFISCDQAALRTLLSVCTSVYLSVRLSVCPSVTPFLQCPSHCIILKFSGVITIDKRDAHAKGQCQRSKVTEVMTHLAVSGP